jgi:hypothetical protein
MNTLKGHDSSGALNIMAGLAESYWNSSQISKALELQTNLLTVATQRLGPYDPKALQAMDNLGRTCWLCDMISKAETMRKWSLEGLTGIVG